MRKFIVEIMDWWRNLTIGDKILFAVVVLVMVCSLALAWTYLVTADFN